MILNKGKAWVFEGVLDVDWEIMDYNVRDKIRTKLGPNAKEDEIAKEHAKYLLVNVDPDFPKKVHPGDYIVGGEGVGYGHDHTHGIIGMTGAGIGAVLCERTNTNFKRNCIHLGIPLVEVKGIMAAVKTGDELEVDLSKGVVKNLTSRKELLFQPYPDFLINILEAGGLYQLLKKNKAEGQTSK